MFTAYALNLSRHEDTETQCASASEDCSATITRMPHNPCRSIRLQRHTIISASVARNAWAACCGTTTVKPHEAESCITSAPSTVYELR